MYKIPAKSGHVLRARDARVEIEKREREKERAIKKGMREGVHVYRMRVQSFLFDRGEREIIVITMITMLTVMIGQD